MWNQNPKKWRYTYESQSHIPILKLFIFSPQINPITHCKSLNFILHFEKSLIEVTWNDEINNPPNLISLLIPLPRVLVDLDSPLNHRTLNDHIEVKIPLLLSVDHPIVSSFISELSSGNDDVEFDTMPSHDFLQPLSLQSDFNDLSSRGDVDFYCRSCGFKLTKSSVRCLAELPSVNWTDVADNWFGSCCCSFGSESEKLVAKYVKSYRCEVSTCLLTPASVILCKDDVAGFLNLPLAQIVKSDDNGIDHAISDPKNDVDKDVLCGTEFPKLLNHSAEQDFMKDRAEVPCVDKDEEPDNSHKEKPPVTSSCEDFSTKAESEHRCCTHDTPESISKDQELNGPGSLQAEQKSLLNCYLGDAFLFKLSGLSKDIEWVDFACPQCSCILGAYPCSDGSEPVDGGIRLLKFKISSSPSSLSEDLFRKYSLERLFTCQLLENAKDELSFRTVIKDLETKSSMLHIILVNPNSWCCSGLCSEDTPEQYVKINLHPVIKVLFYHCSDDVKEKLSSNQEWENKYQADEVYMLKQFIKELIMSMDEAKDIFPDSFNSTNGFMLSSISR